MSDMNENEVNTFKDFSQCHLSINTVVIQFAWKVIIQTYTPFSWSCARHFRNRQEEYIFLFVAHTKHSVAFLHWF